METVAALVSGGVDSAVSVHLLHERGVRPHLFYIKIGPDRHTEWNCTSEEDLEICRWLARRYGLKLDVVDLHREYWDKVVGYTMEKARQGLTPNPDVMCNRLIKFGCFEDRVGHHFNHIATGHYAATTTIGGKVWLSTAADPVKDQTDFLCQIDPRALPKLLFPVGGMLKSEVRAVAEREGLLNAARKDSQGVCFLGDIDFRDYIKTYLGENPGDVRELETGRKIGQHRGLWFYTIGQRKGLGLGEGPWFVVKKNIRRNILFVSRGYDPERVYSHRIRMSGFHFITEDPFAPGSHHHPLVADGELPVTFKIRHTPDFTEAFMSRADNGGYVIRAGQKIHGVAAGQFCVVYDTDRHLCFGGGEIAWR